MLARKNELLFSKEYWTGHSRDGVIVNGDGYNYYRMYADGLIIEAYEVYEKDDGEVVAYPLPEMRNVGWIKDLGFEDLEVLEMVNDDEFERIKDLVAASQ